MGHDVSDFMQADDAIIKPMVKTAADKYMRDKKLTRRTAPTARPDDDEPRWPDGPRPSLAEGGERSGRERSAPQENACAPSSSMSTASR